MTTRLYILLILALSACTNADSSKNEVKTEVKNEEIEKAKTLNDSIFSTFLNCVSSSQTTEMYWYNIHAVVQDDELPGEKKSKLKDDGKTLHGYLNDRKLILEFIKSFPIIEGRADNLEFVRVASDDYLTLICDKDTLLTFDWDIGKHQIHVNQQWYKIDFRLLENQLKKIRTDKK